MKKKKSKMANVTLEILDGFSSVLVLMYRYPKSSFLQVTLNFEYYKSKLMFVVDIPTQFFFTLLLSIDHSSRC